jgi:CHAT domain-containing protein
MFLKHTAGEKEQLAMLHKLYQQVWEPLASSVKTEKVIVVPDGVLYNFSFDMLPFEPVTQYRQLYSKSLLTKYIFSYHYSLFLLGNEQEQNNINENYVAFAPGFSDELKKDYAGKVKDSLYLDQSYLTMLPQPNTNVLAKKIKENIGGIVYLGKTSTQRSFRENAGGHRLIHIATHAEYNNSSPEKSGLIFAKTSALDDSNRLYLTDLYNCELSSDVTILTACESGRPGYQDGEGMVSLAHAFNYAGSRNILTALWKIDERSSSQITESFIRYIKDGMATDEALRQAKLDYLNEADGRLADPGYWAGLVLMGRPLEVQFSNEATTPAGWVAAAVLFVSAIMLLISRRRIPRNAG